MVPITFPLLDLPGINGVCREELDLAWKAVLADAYSSGSRLRRVLRPLSQVTAGYIGGGMAHSRNRHSTGPLACVIGDTDLIRPLGMAGLRCSVVALQGAPARASRFVVSRLKPVDPWADPVGFVERLLGFAAAQGKRPVLYYQGDGEMLAISRHRGALMSQFDFIMPSTELMEDLADKTRFQVLSTKLGLRVPSALLLRPATDPVPHEVNLNFPVIVKPATRDGDRWDKLGYTGKGTRVDSLSNLRACWQRLSQYGGEFLAQELIPGPESRVESYHTYVDHAHHIAGEFTGVKIRTLPAEFGHSTAVAITNAADVREEGRRVVRLLGLHGVAKVDFKRSENGELYLLEVNPRFNLWHHLGAVAGVNLPAIVYADLVGLPRPPLSPAIPGICWSKVWADLPAAKTAGVGPLQWLRWTLQCEVKRDLAWDDPGPSLFLGSYLLRKLTQRRW